VEDCHKKIGGKVGLDKRVLKETVLGEKSGDDGELVLGGAHFVWNSSVLMSITDGERMEGVKKRGAMIEEDLFCVTILGGRADEEAPLEEGLGDDGGEASLRGEAEVPEAEATAGAGEARPSGNLAGVVGGAAAGGEAAVPLHPTVGILRENPTLGFPILLGGTTEDAEMVDAGATEGGGEPLGREAIPPAERAKLLVLGVEDGGETGETEDGGADGAPVAAAEDAEGEHLAGGEIGTKIGKVGKGERADAADGAGTGAGPTELRPGGEGDAEGGEEAGVGGFPEAVSLRGRRARGGLLLPRLLGRRRGRHPGPIFYP